VIQYLRNIGKSTDISYRFFNARQYITILHLFLPYESGFLGTTRTGKLYGEFEGLITLFIINSFTCLFHPYEKEDICIII